MHVCVCMHIHIQMPADKRVWETISNRWTPQHPLLQPHKESSLCLVFLRSLCSQGDQGNERKKDRGHQSWKEEKVKIAQSCPTLCDPMDCIDHGILQARILEGVAFPFSRGSS